MGEKGREEETEKEETGITMLAELDNREPWGRRRGGEKVG